MKKSFRKERALLMQGKTALARAEARKFWHRSIFRGLYAPVCGGRVAEEIRRRHP